MKTGWFKHLFIVVTALLYFTTLAVMVITPESVKLMISSLCVTLLSTAILFYMEKERVVQLARSLFFKNFLSALISASLIFAILGIVNYMGYKHPLRFDLSDNKISTLTQQTKQIIQSIDKPVAFTIVSRVEHREIIASILKLYSYEKSNITIHYVDAESAPDRVKALGVTRVPTVVVQIEEKKYQVFDEIDELKITNALLSLTRTKRPLLWIASGHNEISFKDGSKDGATNLLGMISESGYDVEIKSLYEEKKIPESVDTLVILAPKKNYLPEEILLLDRYLQSGGRLFIGLDPVFGTDFHKPLRELLKKYGMLLGIDLVIDTKNHISSSKGTVPIIKQFDRDHVVTRNFDGEIFLPLVSSIRSLPNDLGRVSLVAYSSEAPHSYAEKNVEQIIKGSYQFDRNIDQEGPIPLIALFTEVTSDQSKKRTQIVALGNGSFVTNAYTSFGNNHKLFLNSLAWLLSEYRLISFDLPVVESRPIFVSRTALGAVFYLSVLLIPMLLLIVALVVFLRRRKL